MSSQAHDCAVLPFEGLSAPSLLYSDHNYSSEGLVSSSLGFTAASGPLVCSLSSLQLTLRCAPSPRSASRLLMSQLQHFVALTDDGSGSVSENHKWGRHFKNSAGVSPSSLLPSYRHPRLLVAHLVEPVQVAFLLLSHSRL